MSSLNSRERLVQSVISGLRDLDSELDLMNQAVADRTGLNRTDVQCVDIITRNGPITPGALAQRLGLTPGAVTTSIDRLVAAGWVVRRHDTTDRRRVLVERNQDSWREARALYRGLQRATQELADEYSAEQLELIIEFLRRIGVVVANHRRALRR